MRIFYCFIIACLLCGCARDISDESYTSGSVGGVSNTFTGIVIKVRKVKVKEADKFTGNQAGMALGAVAGGISGNMIGGGRGRTAATAIGALAGGLGGGLIQDKLSTQTGLEYTVKLDNGRIVNIVQSVDNPISVGTKVFVMIPTDGRGRARVVAV